MKSYECLQEVSESHDSFSLVVKKPSKKYFDEFLRSHCSLDLLSLELFPNSKEITESFAAYNAVRKHLWSCFSPDDNAVTLVVVGDGRTPRTAATFAFRTKWYCISVDPALNRDKIQIWESKIQRLHCFANTIQDFSNAKITSEKMVVVAVHAHVRIEEILNAVDCTLLGLVSNECCVPQKIDPRHLLSPHSLRQSLLLQLSVEYDDWGIWSPKRTIKVWTPCLSG